MEDSLNKAQDEADQLVEDYCKSRRDSAYCRQEFKTALEKFGLPSDRASHFSNVLDDWYDELQKELARVLASRKPPSDP